MRADRHDIHVTTPGPQRTRERGLCIADREPSEPPNDTVCTTARAHAVRSAALTARRVRGEIGGAKNAVESAYAFSRNSVAEAVV